MPFQRRLTFQLPATFQHLRPGSFYVHNRTRLQVFIVHVPGPLCYLTVAVPTVNWNSKGLPHTLEHLIFCGSKKYPHRGFLDTAAIRSLSQGTNAYTEEDVTVYELETAGKQGLLGCLGVFLDHILNPTLHDLPFLTEVFHLDQDGKSQGVVYNEMLARENSDSDLLDLHLRRALYTPASTYHHEAGGLTREISQLLNQDCRDYHRLFYRLDNMAVVISGGDLDDEEILNSLDSFLPPASSLTEAEAAGDEKPPPFIIKHQELPLQGISKCVPFPSSDTSEGSIAYGFIGPDLKDLETFTAVSVLLRYLTEDAASPLNQHFVEIPHPRAGYVWHQLQEYPKSYFVIGFGSVRYNNSNEDSDIDAVEEEEDQSDDESGSSDTDSEMAAIEQEDLYAEQFYKNSLLRVLQEVAENGFMQQKGRTIRDLVKKERITYYEALELSPHGTISSEIVRDVVLRNYDQSCVSPVLFETPKILNELEGKDDEFWKCLFKRWFIDPPCVEIKLCPDQELGPRLELELQELQKTRINMHGVDHFHSQYHQVQNAMEKNKVDLPEEVKQDLPPVPSITGIPVIPLKISLQKPQEFGVDVDAWPFSHVIHGETLSYFTAASFMLPISNLPVSLRPYLVLFSELLFQCPLKYPKQDSLMDYRQVSKKTQELLVSHSCTIGQDSSTFSASWLTELLCLDLCCEPVDLLSATRWVFEILMFSEFEPERLSIVIKKLLSMINEIKRDGEFMLNILRRRFVSPISQQKEQEVQENEYWISIFVQKPFLEQQLLDLDKARQNLNMLRFMILQGHQESCPGLIKLHKPWENAEDYIPAILQQWNTLKKHFPPSPPLSIDTTKKLPFVRKPYLPQTGAAFHLNMSSVTSSFLSSVVACDTMDIGNNDQVAVRLFCELLSRSEGPLYTRIRGKGYAYGASLWNSTWKGLLIFEVTSSSEPLLAYLEFKQILKELESEAGWNALCNEESLIQAKAGFTYDWFQERATGSRASQTALASFIKKGKPPVITEAELLRQVESVTTEDLNRVYHRYLEQFLNNNQQLIIMITPKNSEKLFKMLDGHSLDEEQKLVFQPFADKVLTFLQ